MYKFVVFPDPLTAGVTLTPDASGVPIAGAMYTDHDGRQGQVCQVPDGTPTGQGAALDIVAPGYVPAHVRGFLQLVDVPERIARLQVDDVNLTPAAVDPEVPPVNPDASPFEIINHVYETTRPNLATVEGCGKFTEDCCTALHTDHSNAWGHVKKNPGQNQYNGHAVDALMLLGAAPDTSPGIYDIVFSSASPEAKPAFNYAGPPDYALWYYPATAYRIGVTKAGTPVLRAV